MILARDYIAKWNAASRIEPDTSIAACLPSMPTPLAVRLIGLKDGHMVKDLKIQANISAMSATAHDSTNRFDGFIEGLLREYDTAGMTNAMLRAKLREEHRVPGYAHQVIMLTTTGIQGKRPHRSNDPRRDQLYAATGTMKRFHGRARDAREV